MSHQKPQNRLHFQMLDFFLSPIKSSHTGSLQRRKDKSGCSEDSARTHSSLSHECASDRGLSLLTPKLVVAICAKVSSCSFSKRPQTPASCLFTFAVVPVWRPDVRSREGDLQAPCHHSSRIFFFFLPSFNNPYGLQIGAEMLPSCS